MVNVYGDSFDNYLICICEKFISHTTNKYNFHESLEIVKEFVIKLSKVNNCCAYIKGWWKAKCMDVFLWGPGKVGKQNVTERKSWKRMDSLGYLHMICLVGRTMQRPHDGACFIHQSSRQIHSSNQNEHEVGAGEILPKDFEKSGRSLKMMQY
jgi:hypothetical protein